MTELEALEEIKKIVKQNKSAIEKRHEIAEVVGELRNLSAEQRWENNGKSLLRPQTIELIDFYLSIGWLGARGVDWEDWEDLLEEGLNVFMIFLESDIEKAKDLPEVNEYNKRYQKRIDELAASEKYKKVSDSWFDMGW